MKTTRTITEEVTFCDSCGKEETWATNIFIEKCYACEKDVCSDCSVTIKATNGIKVGSMCKSHLPKPIDT